MTEALKIADFVPRHVPGLYSLAHFEHPSGAFIQRTLSAPVYWVYRAPCGDMRRYYTYEGLVSAVEHPHGSEERSS